MRELKDDDGETWMVYEVQRAPSASDVVVPEELREGWLCFESPTHKKRIAPIPPAWRDVSDEGLMQFARGISAAPKRHV